MPMPTPKQEGKDIGFIPNTSNPITTLMSRRTDECKKLDIKMENSKDSKNSNSAAFGKFRIGEVGRRVLELH